MSRVEQELSDRKAGFALFETAVQLEETVSLRTKQLEELKTQLAEEKSAREALETFKRDKLLQLKQATEDAINKTKAKVSLQHCITITDW